MQSLKPLSLNPLSLNLSADVQLSDLMGIYPKIDTPGFQTLITNKKEFWELRALPGESRPIPPERFFRNQKLIHRYLRTYNNMLLCDDTGTGKTCTIAGLTEYYKNNKSHIKHAYIIVSGKTQKQEFKRQLACVCSDGSYLRESIKRASTERSQVGIINKEIAKWYTVTTYKSFTKKINKRFESLSSASNSALKSEYSGSVFFVDEVQNIKIDPRMETGKLRERGIVYSTLWRLFHVVESSKIVLASATPMMNDVREIGPVMNLILPLDRQIRDEWSARNLPVLTGINFTPEVIEGGLENATTETMLRYFGGRVSYVRASGTSSVPVFKQVNPGSVFGHISVSGITYESQQPVYLNQMSEFQSNAYRKATKTDNPLAEQTGLILGNDPGKGVYDPHSQACNFIYPDGSWGGKKPKNKDDPTPITGYYKYLQPYGSGNRVWKPTEEFRRHLRNENPEYPTLRDMSIKAYNTMNICSTPGKTYIYCHYVKAGGVHTLDACLDAHLGYQRFMDSSSPFSQGDNIGQYCPTSGNEDDDDDINGTTFVERRIKESIHPHGYHGGQYQPYRYATIDRYTTDPERNAIFELFNCPENADGDYIKVVIVSPIGQFGINFYDCKKVVIYGPEWTPAVLYQSMNRAFRALSHIALIERERERRIAQGRDRGENIVIDVDVYEMACVLDNGTETVETVMYKKSEYKDRQIKKMMRIMKQCSVNCHINKLRNIRPTDVDYSPQCDYDLCEYECAESAPINPGSDRSTYNVYYVDELADKIIDMIIRYFKSKSSARIDDLRKYMPDIDKDKYFYIALEKMIKSNRSILDKFGFRSYIREDRGVFYLSRTYPRVLGSGESDYASEFYNGNLIGVEIKKLVDLTSDIDINEITDEYNRLIGINPDNDEFSEVLDSMDAEIKAYTYETTYPLWLKYSSTGMQVPRYVEKIIDYFKNNNITILEPLSEIAQAAHAMVEKKSSKFTIVIQASPGEQPVSPFRSAVRADTVNVHNIYTLSVGRTEYAGLNRYYNAEGRLRIYKFNEGIWKDINPYEKPVYQAHMVNYLESIKASLREKYMIYGIITKDGRFNIRDDRKENKEELMGGDSRKKIEGTTCTSWHKSQLIDVMYELGVPIPANLAKTTILLRLDDIRRDVISKMKDKDLEKQALEWSADKIEYFYRMRLNTSNKKFLCDYISLYMIQNPDKTTVTSLSGLDTKRFINKKIEESRWSNLPEVLDEALKLKERGPEPKLISSGVNLLELAEAQLKAKQAQTAQIKSNQVQTPGLVGTVIRRPTVVPTTVLRPGQLTLPQGTILRR